MAADLGTLKVSIDGSSAVSSAQQITAALKEMGQAGDTAAASVQGLQEIAAKPIGTGGAAGATSAQMTAQLVAGFERARQVMQEMQEQAKGMADIGLGAQFAGIAAGANEVTAALTEAINIFKDMVAEGASVEEILAAMKEQAMGLPEGFEKLSAMEKMTFVQMQADIEGTLTKYKAFQNAQNTMAKVTTEAGKQFQEQEKQKQRAIDEETAALKRQEQQLLKNANIHRVATQEMRTSPLGGAVSTMMNISMGASMMGQGGLMGPIMGIQMLGTGLTEAGAGATTFGAAFMALIPILAAVATAIAGVAASVKVMQEALKSAAEEQTLQTRLTAITGNAQSAQQQMDAMKSFVTGGEGGFLKLPDVAAGTSQLENLIGPAAANKDIIEGIAGSAAKAGKSYQELASQVGAVIAKMAEGAPIRETGLIELQKEGVLTRAQVTELGKMIKAHGDAATAVKMLTDSLHANAPAAAAMTSTWDGLMNQLQNIMKIDVLTPLGDALVNAFTPAIQTLIPQLQQLGADVAEGFKTGNFAPLIEDALKTALTDGWKTALALITQTLPSLTSSIFQSLGNAFMDGNRTFISGMTTASSAVGAALSETFQKVATLTGQTFSSVLAQVPNLAGSQLLTGFANIFADLQTNMIKAFQGVVDKVGTESFWASLGTAIASAAASGMANMIKQFAMITDLLGAMASFNIPRVVLDTAAISAELANINRLKNQGPESIGKEARPEELPKIDVTGDLGGAKAAKQAKDAWKDLANAIKAVSDAEKEAGNQVKLYQAQAKAGLISVQDEVNKEAEAYVNESDKIAAQIPILQQQLAAAKAANNPAEIEKATDALTNAKTRLAEIVALYQQLGLGTPWQNFAQGAREAANAWGTLGQQMIQLGKQITDQLASGLGNAMAQLVEGTGKLKQAFVSMADAIIKSITDMIAKMLVQLLVQKLLGSTLGALGLGFGSGGSVPSAGTPVAYPSPSSVGVTGVNAVSYGNAIATGQSGGMVSGPAGPDKVPSMLTAGEYVLTQRAVDKYGLAMIEAMNRGIWQPGAGNAPAGARQYAVGGLVGAATGPANVIAPPGGAGGNVTTVINVTIPGGTGGTSSGGTPPGSVSSPGQGGLSPQQLALFQQSLTNVVRDEIVRQKRPGGLLSRQQLGG